MWGAAALLGAVLALLGSAGGAASVSGGIDTVRAFRAAADGCTAADTPRKDCFTTQRAVVRGTERTGARSSEYWVRLDGPAAVPEEVDLGAEGPLFRELQPGDEVTVTLWRDYATALSRDGTTQHSRDTPEGEPEWGAGMAVVCLTVFCYLLYLGTVLLTRPRELAERGSPFGFRFYGVCALCACVAAIPAGIVGAFAGQGAGEEHRGWIVLTAVWLALLPCVYAGVRRYAGRSSRAAYAERLYGPPDGSGI